MSGQLLEDEWEQLGLTVLSTDADRTLVLFSSSDEMTAFRERLDAYGAGVPAGKKHPAYAAFVSAVEAIGSVEPRDRIGLRLRDQGFSEAADFRDEVEKLLDVELWDLGDRTLRECKVLQLRAIVEASHGEVFDEYIGPTISILRVRAQGELIRDLLSIDDVASLDAPPEPDALTAKALEADLGSLPPLAPPDPDAPIIGIIDSGITTHPLIEDVLLGAIGAPERLGYADVWGHGTRMAGLAALGDLRQQLAAGQLVRGARLCSAKVTNDKGDFDDRTSLPKQMREAITSLHTKFGCRIFVLALGDRLLPYDGGKVGAWAATLDELARELDVLICVASGNRKPRSGTSSEEGITEYPRYLTEATNRFFEPAGAVNVLTVGSVAHGPGIDSTFGADAKVRAITRMREPSPFTRVGPGLGGAMKPDIVEYGGTLVYDAVRMDLREGRSDDLPSAGLLTLHHRPVEHLFATGSGTSCATALAALKAGQILRRLPRASANLLRALKATGANIPDEARECLGPLGEQAMRAVCGHGHVDLESAAYSDDSRVVLYAEDELPFDYFAVYEVPIPQLFQVSKGRRHVKVALAYDPPVRHTRKDYAGLKMSFRLQRGCTQEAVFEYHRRRSEAEGPVPNMPKRYSCDLLPGPEFREKGTLQVARAQFQRDISSYGDKYYLVVRCEAGWAANLPDQKQRFALVVEIAHEAEIRLYERLSVRVPAR
jgi:subtilase family protein